MTRPGDINGRMVETQVVAALQKRAMTTREIAEEVWGDDGSVYYNAVVHAVRRLAEAGAVTREPSRPWHPGVVRLT